MQNGFEKYDKTKICYFGSRCLPQTMKNVVHHAFSLPVMKKVAYFCNK